MKISNLAINAIFLTFTFFCFNIKGKTQTGLPFGPFKALKVEAPDRKFEYSFSSEDVLWIAKFLIGEAGGKDDIANHATLWVMFNFYALERHKSYKTFHQFLRAYSTPLQPVLNSSGAAKRHMNSPDFIKTGGYYKGHDATDPDPIPKGVLKKHRALQESTWGNLSATAKDLALRAVDGHIPNPINNATEFDNTRTYYYDNFKRYPSKDQWVKFTTDFGIKKYGRWIGEIDSIDQMKVHAFFIRKADMNLKDNAVIISN